MKRKLFALALTATMVLGLAACGGAIGMGLFGAESGAAGGAEMTSEWAPSGTVSIVVPAGAGGDTDLTARTFAQYAKGLTGVDFIVVNANGASGSVASNQVLQSANDGMTFLYGHTLVNVANIAGITDFNYTAFTLGPTFAKNPAQGLYVNAEKYADLNAFIEAAKAAPGQLKAATEVGAYTYYEILAFEKARSILCRAHTSTAKSTSKQVSSSASALRTQKLMTSLRKFRHSRMKASTSYIRTATIHSTSRQTQTRLSSLTMMSWLPRSLRIRKLRRLLQISRLCRSI